MARKRDLKKMIKDVCGELAINTILATELNPSADMEKTRSIMLQIASLQETTLSQTNFVFDKSADSFENKAAFNKAKHLYYKTAYKSILSHVNQQLQAIVKNMNELLTPEIREHNKSFISKR